MDNDIIVIIGGGIIGLSAAYYLARAGASVTVIEKGEVAAGSSYGNAGLLCPCHSTPLAAPGVLSQGLKWLLDAGSPFYVKPRLDRELLAWLWRFRSFCNQQAMERAVPLLRDLQRASLDLYRELVAQEALACHFNQGGGLALFRTEQGLEHGRHEVEQLGRFGLKLSLLDGAAARALEPAVHADVIGAVYYEEDAFLAPHLFMQGLARAAQVQGAAILTQTELLGFEVEQGRIVSLSTTRGRKTAGQVILAAGAWSAAVAGDLGLKLPLQPAKGYSVTVRGAENGPRKYLYLSEARAAITPMGDTLRLAGTLELAGFDMRINHRRVQGILNAADHYLAAAGPREVLEIWRGLRPCSPDGLPYIGRSRQIPNLIVGAGHAMLGMSMGPVTGQLLAEVAQEKRPTFDLQPYRLERFGG